MASSSSSSSSKMDEIMARFLPYVYGSDVTMESLSEEKKKYLREFCDGFDDEIPIWKENMTEEEKEAYYEYEKELCDPKNIKPYNIEEDMKWFDENIHVKIRTEDARKIIKEHLPVKQRTREFVEQLFLQYDSIVKITDLSDDVFTTKWDDDFENE